MNGAPHEGAVLGWRRAGLVVIGFAAFLAWFWQPLFTGSQYLAHSDLYEYFLPVFLSPGLVWSTHEFAGFPAFADPQASLWYPVHALFSRGLHWWHGFILSAYLLAGVGAFAYVYVVTRSHAAAVLAGLAWPLSEALAEKYPHLATLHGFAWLPAVLACLEQLGRTNASRWMAATALTVGMLILSGHPQVVVYSLYLAGLYGIILGWCEQRGRSYWFRLVAAFALGLLLTAAQILPLAEATQYTARESVGFNQFANSFAQKPHELLTILFPQIRHEGREAPTYVGIVSLVGVALILARGRPRWRTIFWLATAAFCLLLGIGDATPAVDLAYRIPLYDRFRVVARHLALFSFAMVGLGAFGIATLVRGEVSRWRATIALIAVTVVVAVSVIFITNRPDLFNVERGRGLVTFVELVGSDLLSHVIVWVAILVTIGLIVRGGRRSLDEARGDEAQSRPWAISALLLLSVLDLSNSQPVAVTMYGLQPPTLLPASLLEPSVHTRQLQQQLRTTHQRILAMAGSSGDPFAVGAFARHWKISSAGGYGPLLLEHLAQPAAMGTNGSIRPAVLLPRDRSLDVLGVRLIIVPAASLRDTGVIDRGGVAWAEPPLELAVDRSDCGFEHPVRLSLAAPPGVRVRGIALVSHLRCSEDVAQGAVVGDLMLVGTDGRRERRPLRAGIDTAESYHGRPELSGRLRHERAPVFETTGEGNDARTTYISKIAVDQPMEIAEIEVAEAALHGWLTVDRLTLFTEDGGQIPIDTLAGAVNHRGRFVEQRRIRTSRDTDRGHDEESENEKEFVVLENLRAMPRAWMVQEVIELDDADGLDALRYSQRPDGQPFDPARTAFVPLGSDLRVPGAPEGLSTGLGTDPMDVRVRAIENGRVLVETASPTPGFLVLSEIWYPGWTATIDGRGRAVHRADHAVMGVLVDSGRHLVEFRFEPASLRIGTIVSGVSLVLVMGTGLISLFAYRKRR